MTEEMVLVDVYGKEFTFSIANMRWMVATGWIFYLISLIATYIYYKIHPSYCNLSWKAIKNRLAIKEIGLDLSDGLEKGELTLNGNTPQTQIETKKENTNTRNLTCRNEDIKGTGSFFNN